MNKIKIFLVLITLLTSVLVTNAQLVKPKFKELKLMTYIIEGLGTGQNVVITHMLKIDKNGLAHSLDNFYLDGYIKDTTYQVPDTLMVKLNEIFNGGAPLERRRKIDRMPSQYEGPPMFITYQAANGAVDNFGFIDNHIDNELHNAVWSMSKPWPKIRQIGKTYHNKQLEALILKYHLACKFLPQKTHEPPRVRSLELADPGVKH
ncbi:MAG: hypothetical protein JSU01_10250 [Bacteroidetes bacterium]|nr:hypothetical protein [Bacteroidota bacterium]